MPAESENPTAEWTHNSWFGLGPQEDLEAVNSCREGQVHLELFWGEIEEGDIVAARVGHGKNRTAGAAGAEVSDMYFGGAAKRDTPAFKSLLEVRAATNTLPAPLYMFCLTCRLFSLKESVYTYIL